MGSIGEKEFDFIMFCGEDGSFLGGNGSVVLAMDNNSNLLLYDTLSGEQRLGGQLRQRDDTHSTLGARGFECRERPWFTKAMRAKEGALVISEYYKDAVLDSWVLTMSKKVKQPTNISYFSLE